MFSATSVRRTLSQGVALALAEKAAEEMRIETTDQCGHCADVRQSPSQGAKLAVAAKARDTMEVHRMLAHLNENNAENIWDNENRDDGPVGGLRGALACESKTESRAVD